MSAQRSGPEQYLHAEELVDRAHDLYNEGYRRRAEFIISRAQVHATLALAAATVLRTAGIPADGPTASAWRTATTVDKPTERTTQ